METMKLPKYITSPAYIAKASIRFCLSIAVVFEATALACFIPVSTSGPVFTATPPCTYICKGVPSCATFYDSRVCVLNWEEIVITACPLKSGGAGCDPNYYMASPYAGSSDGCDPYP